MDRVAKLASHRAVVIFSKSSSCMCHAVKRLFYEVDKDPGGKEVEWALICLGCNPSVPAMFIGGKLIGSANTIMTYHLNGSLKKVLREASALWL